MKSIDLHGMTLDEAKRYVEAQINNVLAQQGKHTIRVITGKGLHSSDAFGGGVLAKEIHAFVKSRFGRFITKIQESPHEVAIDGIPIRGHFDVSLQRR